MCLVYWCTDNILLLLTKTKKRDDVNLHVMPMYGVISFVDLSGFHIIILFECHFLTRFLNISITCKWHAIYTVLLSIVHHPVCLTNVISGFCCHSFLMCVSHMSSILSVFKLFFVGVCLVDRCLFFNVF